MKKARPLVQSFVLEVFHDLDIRRVFVRGFTFLITHRSLMDPYDHDAQDASSTDVYKDSRPVFARLLFLAASQMDAAPLPERVYLPGSIVEQLKRALLETTARIEHDQIFPLILAFLHSLEAACAGIVAIAQPRFRSDEGIYLVPLDKGMAFPRPRFPMGLEQAHLAELPPPYGMTAEYLYLERYFSYLSAPFQQPPHALTPTLYSPVTLQSFGDAPTDLTLATISFLATKDDVAWEMDDTRFWATRLSAANKEAVLKRLRWCLSVLEGAGVHAFVAPELNIDADAEGVLREYWAGRKSGAKPELGVVGLLHREEHGPENSYVNRPLVLGDHGVISWPYWKLDRFEYGDWPDKKLRKEALGLPPKQIVALDTRFGRVCIVMCKDFLHQGIEMAVMAARPTLIIVPAMTTVGSLPKFKEAAARMATTCHALTVFCNSSIHLRGQPPGEGEPLGFIHLGTRRYARDLPQHSVPDGSVAVVATYRLPSLEDLRDGKPVTKRIFWTADGQKTNVLNP